MKYDDQLWFLGLVSEAFYFLFHFRIVTVNKTFSTCAFLFLEWTLVKAHPRILQEFSALGAEFTVGFVVSFAVDVYHCFDGFLFSPYSGVFGCHRSILSVLFNRKKLQGPQICFD